MSYALAVYNDGKEVLYNATPYNLFWCLRVKDLYPGVHSVTLPSNGIGGKLTFVWGLERSTPDQEVSLGSTFRVKINSLTITGNTVTFELEQDAFGVTAILLSFFYSR